jgi:hypothetical protein
MDDEAKLKIRQKKIRDTLVGKLLFATDNVCFRACYNKFGNRPKSVESVAQDTCQGEDRWVIFLEMCLEKVL